MLRKGVGRLWGAFARSFPRDAVQGKEEKLDRFLLNVGLVSILFIMYRRQSPKVETALLF